MKKFKIITAIAIMVISGIAQGYVSNMVFKTKNRDKTCQPSNASVAGVQRSFDFGKTYGGCQNFICGSGYMISGNTCVQSIIPNVVCHAVDAVLICQYDTNAPNVAYNSHVNFHSMTMFGCSPLTFQINRKYRCPHPSEMPNWAIMYYTPDRENCQVGANIYGNINGFVSDLASCTLAP